MDSAPHPVACHAETDASGNRFLEGAMRFPWVVLRPPLAARIRARIDAAAEANAEQEGQKRKLKAQTGVVEAAYHKVQVTASGYLDVIIAAVDKDSDEAANFRRIRSRVFRPSKAPEAQPLPVPGPSD